MSRIQPNFWTYAHLTKFPESAGTTTKYAAPQPYADAIFKEGRIRSLGTIDRSLSDMTGVPVRSRASVEYNDEDSWFRALYADRQTAQLLSREVSIFSTSEDTRKAEGTPDRVFTGVVRETPFGSHYNAGLMLDDWLLSGRSPFSAGKKMLANRKLTRGLFPQLHEDLIGTVQRAIIGEQTDVDRLSVAGTNVAKGAVEAIPVGFKFIASDGGDIPEGMEPTYMDAPSGLAASVVGTAGATTYTYAVSAITLIGETLQSASVTVINGPDLLTDANYISLTWVAPTVAPEQVVIYRVVGRTSLGTYLTMTGTLGYADGPQFLQPKTYTPTPVSTAAIQAVVPGDDFRTAEVWQAYFLCGHAVNPADMHQLFGPVWETDGEPYRAALEEGVFGVDVLAPGRPGWPFPNPYFDIVDTETGKTHRVTLMFARGSRAFYANQGKAGFAWNMCGIEDVGDGTGESIRKAYLALQWVLEELAASNNGEGYYTGTWAGLPYFKSDPALAMIDTDSIQAAQTFSQELVGDGGIGYSMDTMLTEEISVQDFLTEFNKQYESFSGTNRFGQFMVKLLDLGATHETGTQYREFEHIRKMDPPEIDYANIENQIQYQYRYDYVNKKFVSDIKEMNDFDAQEAYLDGVKTTGVYGLTLIAERAVAASAMARKKFRKAWHNVYQNITTNLYGMREELGNVIFITHRRGLGVGGYVEVPFFVIRHTLNLAQGEVTLRGFYLGIYEGLLAPPLGDSTDAGVEGFVLGDSTSSEAPPAGAYRLS